jgi:predicted ester cyclase
MAHDIAALMRRFVDEAQCKNNLGILDEMMAEDFVDHSAAPGLPPTREGVRMLFGALWAAFPDLHATIHDQFVDGDRVATRKTLAGTNTGSFMGMPPTGNAVAFDVFDIVRFDANGKLAEHWATIDTGALFRGVSPAAEAAGAAS